MATAVEQIKERLAIDEVVSSYMKLEKAGKNLKGKCPFHSEKTPSFYVSPDRGSFYCFGCGAKGDIFSFVEQFEGLDFMGALKLLAEKAGVDLEAARRAAGFGRGGEGGGAGGAGNYAEIKNEKERLYAIMEDAAHFFETALAGTNPVIQNNTTYNMAATEAREYVKKRGITDETVKKFRIGFIPNEWRLLYTHLRENLKEKKYSDSDIEKAGLGKRPEPAENAAGKSATGAVQKSLYDRFRGRIIFPIMDSSGRVIAFSGRIIHDDGKSAKYLNSPDTPLYNKSTVLYGIDKAKQDIRTKNYTILVEGQMDLVLSHQAGIKNTVAVSGTALADTVSTSSNAVNNLGVVRRLSMNLILAFDSDEAGKKASKRSAEIALSLGMDVKIAQMPEGKDPADMILADPESWKNVLRKAKPVVEFQLDSVLSEAETKKLDPRKIPALIREKVLPFVIIIQGAMERAHFIKMISEKTGLAEEAIRSDLKTVERALGTTPTGQKTGGGGIVASTAEVSRLDKISRKLFGLLAYLDREKILDVSGTHANVRNIAGDERYNNLIRDIEPFKNELILEAEIFFGSEEYKKNLQRHIDDLLLNFEEDIIRQDFTKAMADLSRLEKKKDGKNAAEAEELMKKCQDLSVRLHKLTERRQKSI